MIAGTGFRIDLTRLTYLPEQIRARIATRGGYPVLTRCGESTVPGLYFAGAPAAFGLGPSMRFIAGTHNLAGHLARSFVRSRSGWVGPIRLGSSDRMLRARDEPTLQ